jgi:hypothetical protein
MSKNHKSRGADNKTLESEAIPTPVDLLDILAAQKNKIDNTKHRATCLERMELPPQTIHHTKLVAAVL